MCRVVYEYADQTDKQQWQYTLPPLALFFFLLAFPFIFIWKLLCYTCRSNKVFKTHHELCLVCAFTFFHCICLYWCCRRRFFLVQLLFACLSFSNFFCFPPRLVCSVFPRYFHDSTDDSKRKSALQFELVSVISCFGCTQISCRIAAKLT